MSIRVEFYGIARARAGLVSAEVEVGECEMSLAQVLQFANGYSMAARGNALIENGRLLSGLTANLDGQRFISDPATPIRDGQCLLILSADAGG